MIPNDGYLYIATGDNFIIEAEQSAKSLKKVNKNAHITLITNERIKNPIFDLIKIYPIQDKFQDNKHHTPYYYKAKHLYFSSPYQKTFFLDTDTYFFKDCHHLFSLLKTFDLCAAPAPADAENILFGKELKPFTRINTGIILHQKSKSNDRLFKHWTDCYPKHIKQEIHDQAAFMEAFMATPCKYYPLPSVYNARTPFYIQLLGEVHLIHGRDHDWGKLEKRINIVSSNRTWDPEAYQCHYPCSQKRKIINFITSILKK